MIDENEMSRLTPDATRWTASLPGSQRVAAAEIIENFDAPRCLDPLRPGTGRGPGFTLREVMASPLPQDRERQLRRTDIVVEHDLSTNFPSPVGASDSRASILECGGMTPLWLRRGPAGWHTSVRARWSFHRAGKAGTCPRSPNHRNGRSIRGTSSIASRELYE